MLANFDMASNQFLKGSFQSRASALSVRLDAPFNPHVPSTGLMELVASPWPTIVQNSVFDDTDEEHDTDDDGVGWIYFFHVQDGCQSKTCLEMRIRCSKGMWMLLLIRLLLPEINLRR